jgi:hypothetical protein
VADVLRSMVVTARSKTLRGDQLTPQNELGRGVAAVVVVLGAQVLPAPLASVFGDLFECFS